MHITFRNQWSVLNTTSLQQELFLERCLFSKKKEFFLLSALLWHSNIWWMVSFVWFVWSRWFHDHQQKLYRDVFVRQTWKPKKFQNSNDLRVKYHLPKLSKHLDFSKLLLSERLPFKLTRAKCELLQVPLTIFFKFWGWFSTIGLSNVHCAWWEHNLSYCDFPVTFMFGCLRL